MNGKYERMEFYESTDDSVRVVTHSPAPGVIAVLSSRNSKNILNFENLLPPSDVAANEPLVLFFSQIYRR